MLGLDILINSVCHKGVLKSIRKVTIGKYLELVFE